MIELSSQAIFLQDSGGCAAPFDPADLAARIRSVLPESGEDEKKRFAASGLIRGYFYQLNDLTDEYYDFLEVDVTEE